MRDIPNNNLIADWVSRFRATMTAALPFMYTQTYGDAQTVGPLVYIQMSDASLTISSGALTNMQAHHTGPILVQSERKKWCSS